MPANTWEMEEPRSRGAMHASPNKPTGETFGELVTTAGEARERRAWRELGDGTRGDGTAGSSHSPRSFRSVAKARSLRGDDDRAS